MTSQTVKQIITIRILSNISRSKNNQAIKFGQLIECKMRNIYFEKSYTKYGGETSPRAFYKNRKLSIYLDQQSEMLYFFFIIWPKYMKTKVLLTTYFHLIQSFYKKKKSGTSFSALFLQKIFLTLHSKVTKFHCPVAFTSWGIGKHVYGNYLFHSLWRHKLRQNLLLVFCIFFAQSVMF